MSLVFLSGKLEYILTIARIKFKFSVFAFSIGYVGGSEVAVGSEDQL